MGCFSNFAVDLLMDEKEDHSYPSPERQLLWRLDDLKDRLEDLINKGASYRSGYIYTEDDIRYALPEHLDDICKVERAIELAKEDLYYYGGNDPSDLMTKEDLLMWGHEEEQIESEWIIEIHKGDPIIKI